MRIVLAVAGIAAASGCSHQPKPLPPTVVTVEIPARIPPSARAQCDVDRDDGSEGAYRWALEMALQRCKREIDVRM